MNVNLKIDQFAACRVVVRGGGSIGVHSRLESATRGGEAFTPGHRAAKPLGRSREPPAFTRFLGISVEAKFARSAGRGPKRPARRSLPESRRWGEVWLPSSISNPLREVQFRLGAVLQHFANRTPLSSTRPSTIPMRLVRSWEQTRPINVPSFSRTTTKTIFCSDAHRGS
jgi:hypothetical protein